MSGTLLGDDDTICPHHNDRWAHMTTAERGADDKRTRGRVAPNQWMCLRPRDRVVHDEVITMGSMLQQSLAWKSNTRWREKVRDVSRGVKSVFSCGSQQQYSAVRFPALTVSFSPHIQHNDGQGYTLLLHSNIRQAVIRVWRCITDELAALNQ